MAAALPDGRDLKRERRKLGLVLRHAGPGQMLFVRLTDAAAREALPRELHEQGLVRRDTYYNFAQRPWAEQQEYPAQVLAAFLRERPDVEILYVDGIEARPDVWREQRPGDGLEKWNLGREALSRLGVVLVFLLPAFLCELMERRAMDLWSWRAHFIYLEADVLPLPDPDLPIEMVGEPLGIWTEREHQRTVRILQDELARKQAWPPVVLVREVVLPLAARLAEAGDYAEGLQLLERQERRLGRSKKADVLLLAQCQIERARLLCGLARIDEAIDTCESSLKGLVQRLGPAHSAVKLALLLLAGAYLHADRLPQAESTLERAEPIGGGSAPLVRWRAPWLWAELRKAQGRQGEAEAVLRDLLAVLARDEPRERVLALVSLANLYAGQSDRNDARMAYDQTMGQMIKASYPSSVKRWFCSSAAPFFRQIGDAHRASLLETANWSGLRGEWSLR